MLTISLNKLCNYIFVPVIQVGSCIVYQLQQQNFRPTSLVLMACQSFLQVVRCAAECIIVSCGIKSRLRVYPKTQFSKSCGLVIRLFVSLSLWLEVSNTSKSTVCLCDSSGMWDTHMSSSQLQRVQKYIHLFPICIRSILYDRQHKIS